MRPEVSAGYRYRAYAYLELGERVRALNDLDQAIRLKPNDARGYADRAAELYLQRQFDQAIADCAALQAVVKDGKASGFAMVAALIRGRAWPAPRVRG